MSSLRPGGGVAGRGRAKTRGGRGGANAPGAALAAGAQAGRGRGAPRGTSAASTRGTSSTRGTPAGRGTSAQTRGSRGFLNSLQQGRLPNAPAAAARSRPTTPTPAPTQGSFQQRYELLKKNRESERAEAIKNGFLADPDKPRTLAEAITPVGTCQDMCPEFERVERVVQNDVKAAECDLNAAIDAGTGRRPPDEARMVKKFRRAAAGIDEQLPSDLRPPPVLKKTLDYLFNDLLGQAESLAQVHNFIWDRTRAVRNDFSIQQVSRIPDLKITIECYERIARFHILSLHQLALAEKPYEEYSAQQEREQLDKTLLSLIQLYDDNRGRVESPNEAEFRAYCVIFQIQNPVPDLEDRVQNWPRQIATHPRVQRALRMYAAATNTADAQGPLKPRVAQPVAQQNWRRFWMLVKSREISYLMACVAEIYFPLVRRTALNAIWQAYRSGTKKTEDWTLEELVEVFGFETQEEVQEYLTKYKFTVGQRDDGSAFLDLTSVSGRTLPDPEIGTMAQSRSEVVEQKRYGRALPAVISGLSVRAAQVAGLLEDMPVHDAVMDDQASNSLFVSDTSDDETTHPRQPAQPVQAQAASSAPTTALNPFATSFSPGLFAPSTQTPTQPSPFAFPATANTPAATPASTNLFNLSQPTSTPPNENDRSAFGGFTSADRNIRAPNQQALLSNAPPSAISQPTSTESSSANLEQPRVVTQPLPAAVSTPTAGFSFKPPPSFTFGQTSLAQMTPTSNTTSTPLFVSTNSSTTPAAPAQQPPVPKSATFPSFTSSQSSTPTEPLKSTPSFSFPSTTASTPPTTSFSLPSQRPTTQQSPLPTFDFAKPAVPQLSQPALSFTPGPSSISTPSPITASNVSLQNQSQSPVHPPAQFQPQKPAEPSFAEKQRVAKAKQAAAARKDALLQKIASTLITEKYGLLEQFVEFIATPMIHKARAQVLMERACQKADDFRVNTLSQRYGRRWWQVCQSRKLARQGRERRKRLARDADARSQRSRESSAQSNIEAFKDTFRSSRSSQPSPMVNGHSPESSSRTNGDPAAAERSWASASQASNASFASTTRSIREGLVSTTPYAIAAGNGRSSRRMRDSVTSSVLSSPKASPAPRQDTTRSTYFKLKAMGLNPNSPTLHGPSKPLETSPVSNGNINQRKRSRIDSTDSLELPGKKPFTASSSRLAARAQTFIEASMPTRQPPTNGNGSAAMPDEDEELFAAARQVRQAMSESMNLFQDEIGKDENHKPAKKPQTPMSRMSKSLAAAKDLSASFASSRDLDVSIMTTATAPARSDRSERYLEPPPQFRGRVSKFLGRGKYADVQAQRRRVTGARDRTTTPKSLRAAAIENAIYRPSPDPKQSLPVDDLVVPDDEPTVLENGQSAHFDHMTFNSSVIDPMLTQHTGLSDLATAAMSSYPSPPSHAQPIQLEEDKPIVVDNAFQSGHAAPQPDFQALASGLAPRLTSLSPEVARVPSKRTTPAAEPIELDSSPEPEAQSPPKVQTVSPARQPSEPIGHHIPAIQSAAVITSPPPPPPPPPLDARDPIPPPPPDSDRRSPATKQRSSLVPAPTKKQAQPRRPPRRQVSAPHVNPFALLGDMDGNDDAEEEEDEDGANDAGEQDEEEHSDILNDSQMQNTNGLNEVDASADADADADLAEEDEEDDINDNQHHYINEAAPASSKQLNDDFEKYYSESEADDDDEQEDGSGLYDYDDNDGGMVQDGGEGEEEDWDEDGDEDEDEDELGEDEEDDGDEDEEDRRVDRRSMSAWSQGGKGGTSVEDAIEL